MSKLRPMWLAIALSLAGGGVVQGACAGAETNEEDRSYKSETVLATTCSGCLGNFEVCEKSADDTASFNTCLRFFAECHQKVTGTFVSCPEGQLRCDDCANAPTTEADQINSTHCVLLTAGTTAQQVCEPTTADPALSDCEKCSVALSICFETLQGFGNVVEEVHTCYQSYSECYVGATDRALTCNDDAVCGDCDSSAGKTAQTLCVLLTGNVASSDLCSQ